MLITFIGAVEKGNTVQRAARTVLAVMMHLILLGSFINTPTHIIINIGYLGRTMVR